MGDSETRQAEVAEARGAAQAVRIGMITYKNGLL
jgi:hypothetical protein